MQGLLSSSVYMQELKKECKNLGMTSKEDKVIQLKVMSGCAHDIADAMLKARSK